MAHVKIEMDRGNGWEVRQEGDCEIAADALVAMLPQYAIQYPHRASIDGVVVGQHDPR